MVEGEQRRIVIKDTEPEVVRALLEYSYGRQVDSSKLDMALLRLADCYQMTSLMKLCAATALEGITSDNVCAVVHAFRQLRDRSEMVDVWSQLVQKVRKDGSLCEVALMMLGTSESSSKRIRL